MYRVDQALDRMDLSGVKLLDIDETPFRGATVTSPWSATGTGELYSYEGKSSETVNRLAV